MAPGSFEHSCFAQLSEILYYKEQQTLHTLLYVRFYYTTKISSSICFLLDAHRPAIGQLRVPSHQLEVENGRDNGVPREERICRLCHIEIADQYHFICKCPTYVERKAKYQDILGPWPLPLQTIRYPRYKETRQIYVRPETTQRE